MTGTPRRSGGSPRRVLAHALAELPDGSRDVLLLVAWAELSYEETAEALAIPVGTVRSRLSRARRQVRRALDHVAHEEIAHERA
jgi:RNA polymerase sigma-70 factor (ECF subfamily)